MQFYDDGSFYDQYWAYGHEFGEALHRAIESTLFTIHPKFDYNRLTDAIDLLARIVHDYPGDGDDIWSIGESGYCDIGSMIVGAFWHYTEWHAGQWSPSYKALCALGTVFDPRMSNGPEPGSSEYDCFKALDTMARKANGMPVYRFAQIYA
jgi:hypothetical protein